MANRAEAIVLFDVFFILLLNLYGNSIGGPVLGGFQTIAPPNLAKSPPSTFQNCQNTDAGCIASNLALATAYVGYAIVNLPILFIYFLTLVIQFLDVALGVAFSPGMGANGIPVVGIVFIFLQFFVVWQILREFRGSTILGL